MEDLSLHILDVVENSIAAQAKRVEIRVHEDEERDLLSIEIKDDGKGMTEEMVKKAMDPFFTTRTTRRVGLGLSLFAQAARESKGTFAIESKPDQGTRVHATFQYSNVDRKPWGKMTETLITLIVGNPDVDFYYCHRKGNFEYILDTAEIRSGLEGLPINHPSVAEAIRGNVKDNLRAIGVS
jgi:anti-sigma regulatory factor (Ser/Thr protein kinase)